MLGSFGGYNHIEPPKNWALELARGRQSVEKRFFYTIFFGFFWGSTIKQRCAGNDSTATQVGKGPNTCEKQYAKGIVIYLCSRWQLHETACHCPQDFSDPREYCCAYFRPQFRIMLPELGPIPVHDICTNLEKQVSRVKYPFEPQTIIVWIHTPHLMLPS